MASPSDGYQLAARTAKASRLAVQILRTIDADKLTANVETWRNLGDDGRTAVAALADVKFPSDLTWQMACDEVARALDLRANPPTVEDVFAGLPK